MTTPSSREYTAKRDPSVTLKLTLMMAAAIAAIGYIMMTIGSSPTVKGASFIWLPAALQLAAGVWLGPWLGAVAGGAGAYLAGILAYGGWGLVDVIMNPLAGGLYNSMLPGLMFRAFRIDPTFGVKDPEDILQGIYRMMVLTLLVLGAGLLNIFLKFPQPWGLLAPFVALIVGVLTLFRNLQFNTRHFSLGIMTAVVCSLLSALVGSIASVVNGRPIVASLIDPGVGWFSGDTVSALLSLYLLALFTPRVMNVISGR